MNSENKVKPEIPESTEKPIIISSEPKEAKEPFTDSKSLKIINLLFSLIKDSNLSSSIQEDFSLNKILEILKKDCDKNVPKNGKMITELILENLQVTDIEASDPPQIDSLLQFENYSTQNTKSVIAKVISLLLRDDFKITKNNQEMLKLIQVLSTVLLFSDSKQTEKEKEFQNRIDQLETQLKNQAPGSLNNKYLREIEEIKNYNQCMIDLYEKESDKLRLKLKSYKKAVNTQLDNLNLKLGFSSTEQNGLHQEPTSSGELGNLPFGMDQDSGIFSAKEQVHSSFNGMDRFNNPFDQFYSFPRKTNATQNNFKTRPMANGYENGLTPSVLRNFGDNESNGFSQGYFGGDVYKNFFTPRDMQMAETPHSNSSTPLVKRGSEKALPSSIQENKSFKKLGSISKVSLKSKKSRQVKRQDLRYWTLKKAVFCWDGNVNLEIVYKEFVKNLSKLLGDLVSPKEPVIQDLKIKAFTKSNSRQNLLAIKMILNPRYKSLIEQSWKNGSPSEFFKLKIDLIKDSSILYHTNDQEQPEAKEIKNMKKFPARYNFSQATYNFTSDYLNKDTINQGILNFLKQLETNK
jgi:hypothetical protein